MGLFGFLKSGPAKKVVLHAEDEPDIRTMIEAVLHTLDLEVVGAANGAEALKLARENKPDLILLSAGYDAYQDDPLGGMRVTAPGFGRLTASLAAIADHCCGGRVVAVPTDTWAGMVLVPKPAPSTFTS